MTYDAVVLGAGLAGLSAGVRLAEAGRKVLVAARGVGAIQLGGATIDVLGYAPDRVASPLAALERLVAERPEHPYARVRGAGLERALSWFLGAAAGLGYRGSLDANSLLPTAVGAVKPTAAAPESFLAGDVQAGAPLAIVGLRQLKDFYPAYLADNLRAAGLEARAVELARPASEADVTPVTWARLFDTAEFRKRVIDDLSPRLERGETVGFPAVLGLNDPRTVWSELQDGLGAPVFEIPTLPPSVPGIRLFRVLKGRLRAAGGRLLLGPAAVGAETRGRRVEGVALQSAARTRLERGRCFVLATGGFASGGFELDSHWRARETVFGLPLDGVPDPGEPRFAPEVFGSHALGRAGLRTDARLRPVVDGSAAFDNLYAVGAALWGAEPWREKSGDGISLATGHRAAELVLEEVA